MTLIDKFVKEIENEKFTPLELLGFQKDPELALLAGAVLGYRVALRDVQLLKQDKESNEN